MKYSVHKLNTRMVAMVIMLVCFGTLTVQGADLSDCLLKIAGVDVTTDNAANVTAPEGSGCEISGVSYDVASHTLTLDNAVIKAPRTGSDYGPNAIWYIKPSPDDPDLTIRLIGKSYIETAYEAIYVTGNLIIKSGHPDSRHRPVLQVRVTDENSLPFSGINLGTQDNEYLYSTLDIYDCDVDVESPAAAILGYDNYGDGRFVSLYVNLHGIATLRAKTRSTSETEGALKNVLSIDYDANTDGSRFQMPRNVEYNSDLMNFTEDGETPYYAKEVRVASHIDFADPEVERLCVENWDENADGKLDNIEASRVTNLGYVFQDNEEIWCFDELDEFYGLENIGQAFQGCTNLSGVTLPYYLKTTGPWVLRDTKVGYVSIPPYVEEVSNWAFNHCSELTDVVFEGEGRLTNIGENAFRDAPLVRVVLPRGLKTIGSLAFWGTNLEYVEIPASVTSIGESAFMQYNNNPSRLLTVKMNGTVPPTLGEFAFGDVVNGGDGTLESTFRIKVPSNPYGAASTATVYKNASENWNYYRDYIEEWSSYGISVAGVELCEDNLGADGELVYYNGFTTVAGVFYDPQTETLTLDNAYIRSCVPGDYAIKKTSLTNKDLNIRLKGESIIESDGGAIYSEGRVEIRSLDDVYYTNRPSLSINTGQSCIVFDNSDFSCELGLEINNVIMDMGVRFGHCIDGGSAKDGDPNSDMYIQVGQKATAHFVSASVRATSPDFVVMQNLSGFSCDNCHLIYPADVNDPTDTAMDQVRIGNGIVFQDDKVKTLCVDNWDSSEDGELDEWEAADVWDLGSVFTGNEEIEQFSELSYFTGLYEIGDEAFKGCTSLYWVEIPHGVIRIGKDAFAGCCNMTWPGLPDKVEVVDDRAFEGVMKENISLPYSLWWVGDDAFSSCMGVNFNRDNQDKYRLEHIGARAFYGCGWLDVIPENVTYIGDEAFAPLSQPDYEFQNSLYLTVYATTPPVIGQHIFGTLHEESEIYVPEGMERTYKRQWAEYKDYIVGGDIATAISQTKADQQRQGVYSIDGRLLRQGTSLDGLPKGIYVVNGKKVMK